MKHKPYNHMAEITCMTDKTKWYWCDEYKTEIDSLRSQIEILREALEKIASGSGAMSEMIASLLAREALQRAGGGE